MLTDRQQKFKEEIEELLLISSSAKFREREYLKEAGLKLRMENVDFRRIINNLTLHLIALEQYETEGLTSGTKELLEKLISTYGKPAENPKLIDWEIEDPDYKFVVSPFVAVFGGWRRKDEKQRSVFIQVLFAVLLAVTVFSIIYLLFPLMQTFLGKKYELGVVAFLTFVCLLLAFFGSFKRNKKKHK